MRGVFDDQGLEPARQSRDTELTLGSISLLAILCGLVLLCGLCFGLGYSVGHRSSGPAAVASAPPASDQEPLQASANIPKPSAVAQTPIPQPSESNTESKYTAPNESVATQAGGAAMAAPANVAAAQPEVHAALSAPGAVQNTVNGTAQAVRPAQLQPQVQVQPQGPQYMVQIAAVSHAEDAEVLTNALKKRSYPVVSKREPADNFIHVRIGPFATRQIADQWRMKLLNDGYNAQIQP